MSVNYDTYDGDSDSNQNDSAEVRISPYTTIRGQLDRVFGAESRNGQSLGINMSDVVLEDGLATIQPDGGYYKLFSWEDVLGYPPKQLAENDTAHVSEAPDRETRTYFGDTYAYESFAARMATVENDDGETVAEASSKIRDFELGGDGPPEFSEWEDLHGNEVTLTNDAVMWFNGSTEHGASVTAQTLAETLTDYGQNAVLDEDDLNNWIIDSSGTDITRDDLSGREIRLFIVQRSGDDYPYNLPIVEDTTTGKRVYALDDSTDDSAEPDTDTTDDGEADDGEALITAKEADSGTYPDPIAEFIQSVSNLQADQSRAKELLGEIASDPDTQLTMDMIEESGGEDAIVAEVV